MTSLDLDFDSLLIGHSVFIPAFLGVIRLPATGGEYMLIPLVPATETNLPCMGLVLLYPRIVDNPHILVHVKLKQRSALPPRLRHNEIVERVVMRNDQVLLDVHQLVDRDCLELVEFSAQALQRALQELLDAVALLDLDLATMARAVPVAEGDLDPLVLQKLLLANPLLPKLLPRMTRENNVFT